MRVAMGHDQVYEPFGSLMPGRNAYPDQYNFGFQGQLKDQEIYGEANSYAFDFRMHDPRVGRFWSVDPLAAKYAYNSPYAFSENRILDMVELEGLETKPTEDKEDDPKASLPGGGENYTETQTVDGSVTGFSAHVYYPKSDSDGDGTTSEAPSAALNASTPPLHAEAVEHAVLTVHAVASTIEVTAGVLKKTAATSLNEQMQYYERQTAEILARNEWADKALNKIITAAEIAEKTVPMVAAIGSIGEALYNPTQVNEVKAELYTGLAAVAAVAPELAPFAAAAGVVLYFTGDSFAEWLIDNSWVK